MPCCGGLVAGIRQGAAGSLLNRQHVAPRHHSVKVHERVGRVLEGDHSIDDGNRRRGSAARAVAVG
eukprot:468821-Rhodomonas_salina.1